MEWGSVVLDKGMGVAASVLLDEYQRRCDVYGPRSHQATSLVASELGFEHNLGLLHKSLCNRGGVVLRMGIPEPEYYLERCLLESSGASFLERGMVMCASVVGDDETERKYQQIFGVSKVVPVPPHLQVPELRLQPASTVGALGDEELGPVEPPEYEPGYCYLALLYSDHHWHARRTLGANPELSRLLAYGGVGRFLPDADLEGLCVRPSGAGYHVDKSGIGPSFGDVLDQARQFPDADEWNVAGRDFLRDYGVGADAGDILCSWLSLSLGRDVRLSDDSLNLVTNSAALLGTEQKRQLRSLEAVGDAVLSMMIARDNYLRKEPVERYQNLRSFVTSNKVLTDKFVEHVPKGAVAFLPNVNPSAGVTGAKALESIFGVVWLELGDESLSALLVAMKFLDFPLQVH